MTSQATTTELAVREPAVSSTQLTNRQIQYIANTDFVPKNLRGNVPAMMACIALGRAMGLEDMVAINNILIVDGRATLSAELMERMVRERGHSIQGDETPDSVTLVGRRVDNGDTMKVTWTLDMAKTAGLLGKDNWKKYPGDMLFARAMSRLCRRLFADCFAGGTYTKEELESGDDVTADEFMNETPAAPALPATHDGEPDLDLVDATVALEAKSDDEVRVPDGFAAVGKTLAEVAESDGGADWLRWASEHQDKFDERFNEALAVFLAEHGHQEQLEVDG